MTEDSSVFRKVNVQRVLKTIKDRKLDAIEPNISHDNGIEYPKLNEFTSDLNELLSLLSKLERQGILKSKVVGNVAVCPHCRSHKLLLQLCCPSCDSANLRKGAIVEHMECGYTDVEFRFRRGEELICPKCRKVSKAVGVDYRKLGPLYKCEDCGSIFPNPKIKYTCSNRHTFNDKE